MRERLKQYPFVKHKQKISGKRDGVAENINNNKVPLTPARPTNMRKLSILALLVVLGCSQKETIETTVTKDEHSYADASKAVVKHLDLAIAVDFDTQTIAGKATWTIDNVSEGNEIVFDENTLVIERVTLGDDEKPTTFTLGKERRIPRETASCGHCTGHEKSQYLL